MKLFELYDFIIRDIDYKSSIFKQCHDLHRIVFPENAIKN